MRSHVSYLLPGSEMRSEVQVVRMLFIFWMFTCVIYAATFSSNLVALLTVDLEHPPFTSLEELAVHQEYKYGILGGTSFVSLFQVTSDQTLIVHHFCRFLSKDEKFETNVTQ